MMKKWRIWRSLAIVALTFTFLIVAGPGTGFVTSVWADETDEDEETKATVMIVWDDRDNWDGKRPEELVVSLWGNGDEYDKFTLKDDCSWAATAYHLEKNEDGGAEIIYTWQEDTPEGYSLTDTSVEGTVTTLTLTHDKEKYELHYEANGGTKTMDPQDVFEGQTFTFPECGFTAPEGKTFDHWEMSGVDSSSSNVNSQIEPANGIFKPGSTVVIASNCASNGVITVTAHWKDAATVTKAPEAINPTYNGSAQELVTAGTAQNGTMNYAIGNSTAPTTEWGENIPTGIEAGTYYVWYKAAGDENFADSEAKCITARIKAPQPTPVQKVASEIQALPTPVTLANKDQVDKVKKDFDALPETQQKQVPANLVQKLDKAVDTIAVLLVSDQIAKLPEPVTLDDAAAVDAAVEAYLALTDSQKAIFSEMDLQKLIEAETAIGTLRAAGITVKIGKVKNLKGGKVRMQLGNSHYNAAKGKAASGKPALSAQEVTGINGFYIQYSTDKKLKKKVKTKKIKDPTAKTATIGKLKKGKTYYFRVCTCTKVTNRISSDTVTVNGKWSAKKKVKITR